MSHYFKKKSAYRCMQSLLNYLTISDELELNLIIISSI